MLQFNFEHFFLLKIKLQETLNSNKNVQWKITLKLQFICIIYFVSDRSIWQNPKWVHKRPVSL